MSRLGFVIVLLAMGLVAGTAVAADLGVVDVDRLVKAHPKSDANREILRDQLRELESEKDAMLETLQGKKESFMDARRAAADPALSDTVRKEREAAVTEQFKALQELEKEMGQRLMGRQREMGDQKLRMHKLVEESVRDMVAAVAAKKKLVLVVDKSALSVAGSNVVVFHQKQLDLTDIILATIQDLRKD
ncbi:MAG: OmpH family outer membrane protein [Verrucomicrobia bacterium]|jgi:Skp family chaperone for outer membrane proteins|nr:OmpH family outer membrane protein [Verrucomicrobiota bacterium]MBT7066617.1 OmpH family outer membrane protein [Verrucomicrobiota bacterium]MBT7699757.1 OmpH family outer membrane protein [Verrucomicrobiota bacterium]